MSAEKNHEYIHEYISNTTILQTPSDFIRWRKSLGYYQTNQQADRAYYWQKGPSVTLTGSNDEVFSNNDNWSNYGTEDENLTLLMPMVRAPRMERRTSSLCLPSAGRMPAASGASWQGSPSSSMNRSTSLKCRYNEDYSECYTPTLFRRQRNPLLARVETPKKSKEHWQKIRKKIFRIKKTDGDEENADQNAADVGFFS